ncbi:phage terminase large subunit [Micromonospora sp. NPDC049230]|uniref:phage terminase large subunit n=1 Tax=Micromonospora sp. NPDC049230 TaxID=3155502 RepID=UPI0033D447EF
MTMVDYAAAWQQARQGFAPKPQRWASPGEMAQALDPKTIQTPALDQIDEALVDVAHGRETRLMISMPPQEGKSQRTSRRFPVWMLARNPDLRISIVSYAHRMARRWGKTIRDDVARHGHVLGIHVDPNAAANEWTLTGQIGGIYTVGITGALTGQPVDLLIIDDPYRDMKQAESEAWREVVEDFWETVAVPRLGPGVAVVIIQTRWRDDDLTGWLQKREDGVKWRVLNIPAQADHDPNKGQTDPLDRKPGEYMVSARGRTAADWEAKKREVGIRSWTALYQGRPAPAAGNIFQDGWWRYYEQPQWTALGNGVHVPVGFDQVIISVDCSFKDTDSSDYVCMQVWGRRGNQAYLLDQVHDRLSFVDTLMRFRMLAAKWPAALLKLIEDKANGTAVINMLRNQIPGIVPIEPTKSKVERAYAVSPYVEARQVWLPAPEMAPWVEGFTEEAKTFPKAANDDRVDTFTQALDRLLLNPLLVEDQIIEDDEDGDPEGSISPY